MGLKNSVNWMSLPLEKRLSAPYFSPRSPAVTVRSGMEAPMVSQAYSWVIKVSHLSPIIENQSNPVAWWGSLHADPLLLSS